MTAASDVSPDRDRGTEAEPEHQKLQMKIGGMHCSFCAQTIERAVGRMDGVDQVNVSLPHEEALVVYDPNPGDGHRGARHVARRRLHRS